jgi:hypothetical protein
MKINFAMICRGRLNHSYPGQADSIQEFLQRYENGEFDFIDESEVVEEELFVTDFKCRKCDGISRWSPVIGPRGDWGCQVKCARCGTIFVIDDSLCSQCKDREVGCLATLPPKGLHP